MELKKFKLAVNKRREASNQRNAFSQLNKRLLKKARNKVKTRVEMGLSSH